MAYGSTNVRALDLNSFSYDDFKVLTLEEKEHIIKSVGAMFFLADDDNMFHLLNDEKVSFEDFHPLRDANHALVFYYDLVRSQAPVSIISDSWYDGEGVWIKRGTPTEENGSTVVSICRDYADKTTTYNQILNEAVCVAYLIIEDAMKPIEEAEQIKNEKSKESIRKMLEGFKKEDV